MTKFPNWYNKVLLYLLIFNHIDIIFTEELEKGSKQSLYSRRKKRQKRNSKMQDTNSQNSNILNSK